MPAKNAIKPYLADGYYHIYNRGVEKRTIFLDPQDYSVFLHIIKNCLSPPPKPELIHTNTSKRINLYGQVDMFCFVLMPNHFHFFVHQRGKQDIEHFMRSIVTRYVSYFNRKHQRQGHLFQGRYKAILVESEPYFLHVTRYIHRNPASIITGELQDYPYSSYPYYLGHKQTDWIQTGMLLSYFTHVDNIRFVPMNSYRDFVENNDLETPKDLILDE